MIVNVSSFPKIEKDEFNCNHQWVNALHQQAKELPIVFFDSYQNPSKYWFYSGSPAFALNTPHYRRNNFNFWPLEDSLNGRKVFLAGYDASFFANKVPGVSEESTGNRVIEFYYSFSKLQVTRNHTISIPPEYISLFQKFPYDTASIQMTVFRDEQMLGYFPTGITVKNITENNMPIPERIPSGLTPGNYTVRYAVTTAIPGICTLNSQTFRLTVK